MAGLAVAADAAPAAGWALSAFEVPGSTTWTVAPVGAVGSVHAAVDAYVSEQEAAM